MKRFPTFCILLCILFSSLSIDVLPLHAGGPRSALGTTGRSYPSTAFPLKYRYDRGLLGAFSNSAARAIADYAFGQWAAVPGSSASFTNDGQLARDVTSATDAYISGSNQYSDGINPVVFDTDGSITDDRLGVGAKNSVLGFAGSAYFTNNTNYAEGYVIINGYLTGTGSATDQQKYEATITHEVGHFLGLSHSQIGLAAQYPTMYPTIVDPAAQRTLDPDDQAAFALLYPNGTYRASVGKISGTVKNSAGTNLSGVNVTAINTSTGAKYSTVVDYFAGGDAGFNNPPAKNGTYTIDGLPPGSYYVRISPINTNFTGGSSIASYNTPINTATEPEWYNGSSETGDMLTDNSNETTGVTVSANGTTGNVNLTANSSNATSSLNEHNGNRWGIISLPNGSVTRYAIRYTAPFGGSLVAFRLRIYQTSTLSPNDNIRISVHDNATGSLAGIPGTERGAVTIPLSRIAADQENLIWLRELGSNINYSNGQKFHIVIATSGSGPIKVEIDNGTGSTNQSSYYINGTWRNFRDGYSAAYNIIATAVYSNSAVTISQPKATVSPTALDFGSLRVGRTLDKQLTLQNTGSAPLSVTGMAVEGPNAAEFSVVSGGGPFTLSPGATRSITVRFAPQTGGGDMESPTKSATLRITSNDAGSPTNVALMGNGIRPGARLTITQINFGERRIGATYTIDTVVLHNPCTDTLHVSSITLSGGDAGGGLRLLNAGPMVVPPDSSLSVRIAFSPTESRLYTALLRITHDDLTVPNGTSDVTILGTGVAPMVRVPESFNFGSTPVGTPIDRTFYLANAGQATLNLTGISISGMNAAEFRLIAPAVPRTVARGDSIGITIRFTPSTRGRRVATVTFTTDAGTTSTLIEGTGLAGQLGIVPTSIDFGQVEVNATADRTVTISNTGNASLTISSTTISGPFQILTNVNGRSLAPNESVNVTLRFQPTASGAQTGQFVVTDNSGTRLTTSLSGQGASTGLTVDNNLIDYGIVRIGGTYYHVFIVRNTGQILLQQISLSINGSGSFALTGPSTFDLAPGDSMLVEVAYTPTMNGDRNSADLIIGRNGQTITQVGLMGQGFERVVDFPGVIDFAERRPDRVYDTTITIRNTGPVAIQIDSVMEEGTVDIITGLGEIETREGEFFQAPISLPLTIEPGGSLTLPIRFDAREEGSYSGAITFLTNSTVDTVISIALFANVVDPSSSVAVTGEAVRVTSAMVVPNPASDQAILTFQIAGGGNVPVDGLLIDQLGRVARSFSRSELHDNGAPLRQMPLDLKGLSQGVYFIILKVGTETVVTPLTVVR